MNKNLLLVKLFFCALFFTVLSLDLHAQPGSALNFDGTNDYINVAAQSTAVEGSFTVMAWVMPANTNKAMHVFSTRESGEFGFDMQVVNGNTIHADIGHGAGFITTNADANYTFAANQWMHIAYVVSPTFYKIYVNGIMRDSTVISGLPLLLNASHYITIGKNAAENTFFEGSIDEMKVYESALTTENIQSDMFSTTPSVPGDLVAYYNFDQNSTTLTDQGSNAYHGTLNNFALTGNTSNWLQSYAMVMPTFDSLSNITSSEFTLHWNAPVVGVVDNYQLEVSTDFFFNSQITGSPFTVNTTSKTITGLLSGSSYFCRFSAQKTGVTGKSASRDIVQINTVPGFDLLTSLRVDNCLLYPTFSSSHLDYYTIITDSVASITAAQNYAGSLIEMNANGAGFSTVQSGVTVEVPMAMGSNIVEIRVTEGGSRTYVLEIDRKISVTRYVKQGGAGTMDGSSWANASNDLQEVINNSSEYDVIWVAGGTYKPVRKMNDLSILAADPEDRTNAFVLKDDVKIYGGFAGNETQLSERDLTLTNNKSILSGDFNNDDVISGMGTALTITGNDENAFHVVISAGESGISALDGFTITGGNSNSALTLNSEVNGEFIFHYMGGGINITNSSPLLNNLIITGNRAQSGGGIDATDAFYSISNSTLSKNRSSTGGGMDHTNSSPTIDHVIISGNRAATNGGGMLNYQSTPTVTNSVITKNGALSVGGGMYNLSNSAPSFTNVEITENKALVTGGAMENWNSSPLLTNVLIAKNSADVGGAISAYSNCYPILTNVTVVYNTATSGGNAFNFEANSEPVIHNSIIWGNNGSASDLVVTSGSTLTIDYSVIEGGHAGTGNTSSDPLFIDASRGNYHLQSSSPAIDSGSAEYFEPFYYPDISNVTVDLDGNSRMSGVVDMGAYEKQALSSALNFDGTDDKIVFGALATSVSENFTVEAWVRPMHATKTMHILSTNTPDANGFELQLKTGNKIHASIGNGNTSLATQADADYNYTSGRWMHIAYTVSPDGYTIYVNGDVMSNGTFSGAPLLFDADHLLQIGNNNSDNTFFNGDIDEVRIYNTVLSKEEIQSDMINTFSSLPENLMAYYNFDDAPADSNNTAITTLNDKSDLGYRGTLTGFALNSSASNFVNSYAMVIPEPVVAIVNSSSSFEANWIAPANGALDHYILEVATDSLFTSHISGSPFTVSAVTKNFTSLTPNANYYYRVRADQSGFSGQGAYSGVTKVPLFDYTPPGNALNFDGADDYVSTQLANKTTDISGSFTVEAWVRPQHATKAMHIFSTRESTDNTFDIQLTAGNKIHADIGSGAGWITNTADANYNYTVNRWLHVAYTVSPTGYKIYANGVEVGSGTYTATPKLLDASHYITLGKNNNENTYFIGDMDEVKVYDRVLTQNEIQADMLVTASIAPSNLVAHFTFDQGIESRSDVLADVSGNGYTGKLNNFELSGNTSNWKESYAMVVPSLTAASNISSTALTVNWTAPAEGTVDNYILDVATDNTFASPVSGSPFTVAGTSKVITGLTDNVTYYYRVKADKASVTGTGAYSATSSATTGAPLPVVLLNYTAKAEGAQAQLKWTTASEQDNKEFIISRSADGKTFEEIGTVEGAGNSSLVKNYFFYDDAPNNGINYYRLEQKNYNGTITGHGVRALSFDVIASTVKLYPNPATDQITLEFTLGIYQSIEVATMNGKPIQFLHITDNENLKIISLDNYPSGIYLIKLSGIDKVEIRKVVKNK